MLLGIYRPSFLCEQHDILDTNSHPSEISVVLPPYITAMLLLPELGVMENSCGQFVHMHAGNRR